MSDTVDLVAIAAVNAFDAVGSTPAGIDFTNNVGFRTATRSTPGVYVLELKHEHDTDKLVVSVSRNNTTSGNIEATILDKQHIQINAFADTTEGGTVAADSPFFIVVWRVRD